MNPELHKKFTFGTEITEEQIDFYYKYGFIHFKNFIGQDQVNAILKSLDEAEQYIIENNITQINGIPLKIGIDHQKKKIVNRMPFSSVYAAEVKKLYEDPRFEMIKKFIPNHASRLGLYEKDGVVSNHFLNTENSAYKQLGWHTDVLRDFVMGQKMLPMINIGVYLTHSGPENGGLRILPGTHTQSAWSMMSSKIQVVDRKEDPNEILVEAEPGDLCLHEGRMWHRVGISPHFGEKSRRRVMYVPMICGKVDIRTEHTKMPFYHKLGKRFKFK
jgi:ectoine hydroxylase-related dioxygenase (phytanoyl-CoA dioxygenase family)